MFRVVTISYLSRGWTRKRVVFRGPLHPDIARAQSWAHYLRQTGLYSVVKVESSTASQAAAVGADPLD